ncbi:MAG: fused MFS/spermidine synthase [Deltaproteobacteria bacterium]|nr:fused MFS/spermidine synthase [Deltaproteobacteria bacterium]
MLRYLVPLLLLLTGTTGLVYEVVMGRLLSLHLGSSGASQAVTLATFLGGMALGAALADGPGRRLVQRLGRPLDAYAALEGFIGLWALAFPFVSAVGFDLFVSVAGGLDPAGAATTVAKLVLAAALILPLTTAMGATLPVLAAGVQRADAEHGVQLVSRYYVVNATGATLGAALAGFVLLEALGLYQPLYLGGAVNLLVAAVALVGARRWSATAPVPAVATEGAETPPSDVAPPWDLIVAAFATGFVALCAEVLWTRLVGLVLGSSVYAFSFMLVVSIFGISLGSGVAAALIGRGANPSRVLSFSQAGAAAAATLLLVRLDALPVELAELRVALPAQIDMYPTWLLQSFGWVALHLLPAAACLGASFPALLAAARARGASTDRATARILSANTIGNLLGSLGCGFVLMPALGIEGAMMLGVVLSLAVAVLTMPRPRLMLDVAVPGVTALTAGLLLVVAAPDGFTLTAGLFRLRDKQPEQIRPHLAALRKHLRVVFRHDGKDATITVNSTADGYMSLRTNGKSDGGTSADMLTQIYSGFLGLLHRPQATKAFVVGFGTGQTVTALAAHPQVEVLCAELSPAVVDAAVLFADANLRVYENPRVRIQVADAREVLRTLPDHSLDIIASEPSNPWLAGVADLFTQEAFARIHQKLRPGGVLVQWLQSYETSDDVVKRIVCTLQSVFPHVAIYRLTSGDLGLVASDQPLTIDFDKAQALLAHPEVQKLFDTLKRPDLPRTMDEVLFGQLCGARTVQALCQGFADPLREERPQIEYRAPRDFFAAASAKRIVRRLDTRCGPDPAALGDTDLVRWLALHPMDEERKAALFKHIKAVNHPSDTSLGGSLVEPAKLPKALRKDLEGLQPFADAPAEKRQATCAQLKKTAEWLMNQPYTILGPASRDPVAQGWAEGCKKLQ